MSARTEQERRRNTEYARKYRAQKVAAANMHTLRCTAMLSRSLRCNTPLQSRFVDGATVPFCPTCDRKARGICIDCGVAPVDGTPRRTLRCGPCRKLAGHASHHRYKKTHASALRKKERARMADPVKHAAKLEYKRLYRALKPTKVQQHKREDYRRNREQYLAYHRAYREKKRAERAAVELARYHGTLPPRSCLTCDTILTGRAKKCATCKQRARAEARAAIAARLERGAA